MNENYLVTKANTLITSNYDLSLEEQRVILTLASTVQPNDEDFKPYEFSIKEFMELLGVESKSKYSVIPKITKELMQKVLEIKQENKITQVAWLSSAEYEKGTGIIELEFSPKLKPFMLGLKEFYTSYRLKNVLELKGKYSIRMYEILKSNEFKKIAVIEVDELRKILKADKGSYLIYQNFKNRIICQAQKELKNLTDIYFEFEEVKTGRKVTSLKFYIKPNKKVEDPKVKQVKNEIAIDKETPLDTIENDIKLIMDITNNEFGEKTIMLFRDLSNGDIGKLKKLYDYMNTKNIQENRTGYMRKLLENWEEPKQSSKINGFNNFESRKYDYNELEKKLLGWD
ncbi:MULTISPECIES: replication initiation protein [Clostridium]|uniref:Replication initiation protein n=1 Tax=Clostridium cibarium TaxID=2762247 RepID=A0ABR8PZ79_9CLOT|nr:MULTISPECIES: replication initiation protein [Clostridium]MBD7913461.1 replication initiation protein [Clostridium cibarium]